MSIFQLEAEFQEIVDLLQRIVSGPASGHASVIPTPNGDVFTLARLLIDLSSRDHVSCGVTPPPAIEICECTDGSV